MRQRCIRTQMRKAIMVFLFRGNFALPQDLLIFMLFVGVLSAIYGQSDFKAELAQNVESLEEFRRIGDLNRFEAQLERDAAKWRQRDRSDFITYMSSACRLLSSYRFGEQPKQATLLGQSAILVLSQGGLSLSQMALFVEFLSQDPIILESADWRRLRLEKARWWLAAWRRVTESTDPKFDFSDFPLLNVAPPRATGLPSGIPPQAIRDLKLRSEYEQAVEQNNVRARKYDEQFWIKQNGQALLKSAERYLKKAYSRTPDDIPELMRLLETYITDDQLRKRIVEAARKRE